MLGQKLFVNTESANTSADSPSDDLDLKLRALFNNSDSDADEDTCMIFGNEKFKNFAHNTHFPQPPNRPPPKPQVEEEVKGPDEYKDERKKYLAPGLVGLKNLGNTCYMNAALQALCATHLASYLRQNCWKERLAINMSYEIAKENKKNNDDKINIKKKDLEVKIKNSLTYQMSRLFRTMYNKNCIVTPKTVKSLIGKINPEFKGFGQNDSQELISCLLDTIHEQTKREVDVKFVNLPPDIQQYAEIRKKCDTILNDPASTEEQKTEALDMFQKYRKDNDNTTTVLNAYIRWKNLIKDNHSIITDLFTGMFCSVIECSVCKSKSRSFDTFTTLSIETAPAGETTLEQCLKDFSNVEKLEGDNQYNCETCKRKVDATKNIYVWHSPEILVVHLKRFKNEVRQIYNGQWTQQTFKTNSTVKFPLDRLNLEHNYMELSRDRDSTYSLNAIVLHKGSCNFGHYIAYSKNAINNEWYEFNDSTVVHIPVEEIESEIVTKDAYVLIYQRNR